MTSEDDLTECMSDRNTVFSLALHVGSAESNGGSPHRATLSAGGTPLPPPPHRSPLERSLTSARGSPTTRSLDRHGSQRRRYVHPLVASQHASSGEFHASPKFESPLSRSSSVATGYPSPKEPPGTNQEAQRDHEDPKRAPDPTLCTAVSPKLPPLASPKRESRGTSATRARSEEGTEPVDKNGEHLSTRRSSSTSDESPRTPLRREETSAIDIEAPAYASIQKCTAGTRRPKDPNQFQSICFNEHEAMESTRRRLEKRESPGQKGRWFLGMVCNCSSRGFDKHDAQIWLLSLLTGATIGCVAYLMILAVKHLIDFKLDTVQELLLEHGLGVAYACSLGFWLVLTLVAAVLTVYAPQAAGSGIPQIKAYLNGVDIPRFFEFRTLVAKTIGIMCCLGVGIPAGREGPMVQIGAILTAGIIRVMLRFHLLSQSVRHPYVVRDFVALGCACGVAAAFNAPIGGILFAIEDVSSYWTPTLTVRTFASACVAAYVVNVLIWRDNIHDEGWVLFGHGDEGEPLYHTLEIFLFAFIAILGGFMGATFNFLSQRVIRSRKRLFRNCTPWARVLEALLHVTVVMSIFYWLPLMASCEPAPSFTTEHKTGIHFIQHECPEGEINILATLAWNPQERLLLQLYSRRTPGYFPPRMIGAFGVLYFILSVTLMGVGVPSGLFVPSMIIGACHGRFWGELFHGMFSSIDPGVIALVGAASSLGGITRMTISLAAILVETTNDINLILPIMLALVLSRFIADRFNYSIYETVLREMGVVLLPAEPPRSFDFLTVADVMTMELEILKEVTTVGEVKKVLISSHNSFPVVDNDTKSRFFRGLVSREQLQKAMEDAAKMAISNQSLPRNWELQDTVVLDLHDYIIQTPFYATQDMSLMQAYKLFRLMGLRQLCVVNNHNQVVGIVTRVDLAKKPDSPEVVLIKQHPAVFSVTEEQFRRLNTQGQWQKEVRVSPSLPTSTPPGSRGTSPKASQNGTSSPVMGQVADA